jgi:uncharacterized membrane protein YphA (DoxX/SURF4 family)
MTMDWKTASRYFFAATMIGIGVIGLIRGGFAPIWDQVPKDTPARELFAYLSTVVTLVCGAGLLARRTSSPAALVLTIFLILWTVAFKFPYIVHGPLVEGSYQSNGENWVLIAGAWILYAEFAESPRFPAGEIGARIAYLLYGLGLIAFGFSHFFYLDLTTPLIPSWLPGSPVFWAYLTGSIWLVTGAALVVGIAVRFAALLSALEITLITLLVWGPRVLAGQMSPGRWQETVVSWALAASALVVAASFEGRPWFGRYRLATKDSGAPRSFSETSVSEVG